MENGHYRNHIDHVISKNAISAALVVPEKEVIFWSSDTFLSSISLIPPRSIAIIAADKFSLYQALNSKRYIPKFAKLDSKFEDLHSQVIDFEHPKWVRPHLIGNSSAVASAKVDSHLELQSHLEKYSQVKSWQLVDYLQGNSYCCALIFIKGEFIAGAQYKRLKYFMPQLSENRITGNIVHGELIYDSLISEICIDALKSIEESAGSALNGFYSVDLMDDEGNLESPYFITEINIRPTACVEAFGLAGFNLGSLWARIALDLPFEKWGWFEKAEGFLHRDIDGFPIYESASSNPYIDLTHHFIN